MAKQLFANNISITIDEFLSASDTTVTVSSTANFPAMSSGDWIMGTIVPVGGQGTKEVIKITAFSGTAVTIVRGQEGTFAQEFLYGSILEFRITKGSLEYLRDRIAYNAVGTGSQTIFTVIRNPVAIYINGLYQNQNTYTFTGTSVTFSEAPPLNTTIEFLV